MRNAPSAASTGPASFLNPADLVEEIHVPGAAAKLAVGHPFEAHLLLHRDGVANRLVLDAA